MGLRLLAAGGAELERTLGNFSKFGVLLLLGVLKWEVLSFCVHIWCPLGKRMKGLLESRGK